MRSFYIITLFSLIVMLGCATDAEPDAGFDSIAIEGDQGGSELDSDEDDDQTVQEHSYLTDPNSRPNDILDEIRTYDSYQRGDQHVIGTITDTRSTAHTTNWFRGTYFYFEDHKRRSIGKVSAELAEDARLYGYLGGKLFSGLRYDGLWKLRWGYTYYPTEISGSADDLSENLVFEVRPDGVMVIRDKLLVDQQESVILAYLYGNSMCHRAFRESQQWDFIWDEDTSWTRECQNIYFERMMNKAGVVWSYQVTCDGEDETLEPNRSYGTEK